MKAITDPNITRKDNANKNKSSFGVFFIYFFLANRTLREKKSLYNMEGLKLLILQVSQKSLEQLKKLKNIQK
jgi:hypothetical protein